MAASDNVQIQITADASGVSPAFNVAVANVTSLEEQLRNMGATGAAAVEKLNTAVVQGADSIGAYYDAWVDVNEGIKNADRSLEIFAGHTATVTKGLDAMGLEAAGASARIEGLAGVLQDFGKAAPELLAITAAILAVSSAFGVFKRGVTDAIELQSTMETLRAAVEAQGGSWAVAQQQILAFAQTESMASGITQNELVGALNKLVTSGTSVADAMKIVGVAEEVAIAKHMDLMEVTEELQEAEVGRGQALAKLDPRIRQMITDHDSLSQILKVLHEDNQKQIDDGDSMERAYAREQAAQEAAAESLGEKMLPALTYLETAMIGGIQAIELFGTAIGTGIHGAAFIFVDSVMAIVHGAEAATDVLKGDFKDGTMQVGESLKSLKSIGGDLKDATYGWIAPLAKGVNDLLHMHQIGHQIVNEAVYMHDRLTKDLSLQNDPRMGMGAGGAGSDYIAPPTQANAEKEDLAGLTSGLTAMDAAQKAVAAGQKELGASINNAATSMSDSAAAAAKLHAGYLTAQADIVKYTAAIKADEEAEVSSRTAVEQKYQAYQEATSKLAALQQALSGKNKLTKDEKDALKEAANAQKTAEDAYKSADESLKNVTESLKKHTAALTENIAKSAEFVAAQNKMIASYNDSISAANQAAEKERDTYDLSIKQLVDYWSKKLSIDEQANEAFYAQHGYWDEALLKQQGEAYTQLEQAQTKAMEDARQAAKKVLEEEQKDLDSFFDDILLKKNGFQQAWKSMWEDMAKSAIENMTKALTQAGSPFQQALGKLIPGLGGGAAGGQNAATQQLSTAATTISTASTTFTSAGSTFTSAGNTFTTAGSTFTSAAQSIAQSAETMQEAAERQQSIGPSTPGASDFPVLPGDQDGTWIGNINPTDLFGTPGSDTSEAMQVNIAGVSGSISSISGVSSAASAAGLSLGGILTGAGVGAGIGTSNGGSGIWGSVGGALGDVGGALLAAGGSALGGLLGSAAGPLGSIIGGYIGSMFGPHTNPTDNPDIYNTNGYDQFVADVTGSPGTFNGNYVDPTSTDWTGAGGTSLADQIGNWLKDNSSDESSLTPAQQSLFQQFSGLDGGGTGANDGLGITGESNGMFTLSSGQQVSVQQYEQLVNQFEGLVGSNGNLDVPAFSISRTYPNFNIASAATATGLVGSPTPTSVSNPSSPSSSGSTPVSTSTPHFNGGPALPPIHLFENATLVGPNGLEEAASSIATVLQRLLQGQIPGAYTASLAARLNLKTT